MYEECGRVCFIKTILLNGSFSNGKNRPNPLNERIENNGQVGCREGYVDFSMNKIVLLSS